MRIYLDANIVQYCADYSDFSSVGKQSIRFKNRIS